MSRAYAGVDDLIDRALGVTDVGKSPHYVHKTAALRLRLKPKSLDTPKLFQQILRRIQTNLAAPHARWQNMGGSEENWRWDKKLIFSLRQTIDEKTMEKLVALDCGEDWVNQVPTASGLMNKNSDKHCNIDLVHKTGERCYEFIELKLDDSTPLFAAFEIVKYSLLFLISRMRREEFKYSLELNPLLWASSVHLVVLGPPEYFTPFSLEWLEEEIDNGLISLSTPEIACRFTFEQTAWPHDKDYRGAMMSRLPVYSV
jgi:hypothetical protein